MQARRSNAERTLATRAALLAAARTLFVSKGYAETGTPEIAAEAGLTRGALYHHFADKQAVFHAVVEAEGEAVAREIETMSATSTDPVDALLAGSQAYLAAMRVPGRTRLLLIEGPAILGYRAMKRLDEDKAARTLRAGLRAAFAAQGRPPDAALDALTDLLSAAFDRAALAIEDGADPTLYRNAVAALITPVAEG
ncbi:transcriptional regulator, TetR family [Devosia enhydra]|uniref:Transcriptional regulator, TetR family n=1 Tax=Devosia enhydra TaxID=665118 RepID=A0A1K2I0B2_9HYPH|nr:TetR/AcrR family transcriptional regulator [Devosia enhydra]SFZ85719.1 transcriptional regulator, TetR family [Devosia enhydra]